MKMQQTKKLEQINRSGQGDEKYKQDKENLLTELDPVRWLT